MIKHHTELAKFISGKTILHLNSLGKESVLCLEWLQRMAPKAKVVSVFFSFIAEHPDDDRYWQYLMNRFPNYQFVKEPNIFELNDIIDGVYQSPIQTIFEYNKMEFSEFSRKKHMAELKERFNADYFCDGSSKYESFARRTKFYQKGLVFKDFIYPLGLMSKDQIYGLLRSTGIKLHPCYKFTPSTYDHPSYFKMRSAMIAQPEYAEKLFEIYPLLRLDRYRYERLLK